MSGRRQIGVIGGHVRGVSDEAFLALQRFAVAGLDAGADDYLTKPFNFGELLARLRALTRRRGEVLESTLTVGDLVIDVLRRTARRGRREITLTNKEYSFLEYLARHEGRIVRRADLLAHVWDESHNPYSNTLDVYASRLRRKIDEGEAVTLFTTHRAIGYMLRAPDDASTSSDAPAPTKAAVGSSSGTGGSAGGAAKQAARRKR